MYKVFYYDRIVLLSTDENQHCEYDISHERRLDSIDKLDRILGEFLTNKDFNVLRIVWKDLNELFEEFVNYFRYLSAAGGLVINKNNQLLCIFRMGRWDLPKGKMEKQENPLQCAVREVREETNIGRLVVDKEIESTYHIYQCPYKNKLTLKKTHWFLMSSDDNDNLVPQIEEDITKVQWCSKQFIRDTVISQSYRSLEPLFLAYLSDF